MLKISKIVVLCLLASSAAWADGHGEHHGHHGHHDHHYYGEHRPMYREEIIYVPERVVEYVQVPAPRYYAPPPPPPRYYGYDQRSPQGLLGGMVGGVMGYELGGGDPLATGMGAAAGAWFGNGM